MEINRKARKGLLKDGGKTIKLAKLSNKLILKLTAKCAKV